MGYTAVHLTCARPLSPLDFLKFSIGQNRITVVFGIDIYTKGRDFSEAVYSKSEYFPYMVGSGRK